MNQTHVAKPLVSPFSRTTFLLWLLGVGIALVLAVHLAFLTRYPTVFIDEPWYADASWNWLRSGINFETMHTGTLDQFGHPSIQWPYFGNVPWVVSFAVLGLGLFQARLVSWVFGVLLVLVTGLVARRAYSSITAVLAAVLLVLSAPFAQASHYARPDVILAAVIMIVYGMALFAFDSERWWAHLIAGLLLGLAVSVHENALMFMPALAGLYLISYRRDLLMKRGTWLCAAGGLAGLGFYILVHIAPDPAAYSTLSSLSFGGPHKLPLLAAALNPVNLVRSLAEEIGRYHFYDNALDFALIGASAAYLASRRSPSDRRLLTFITLAFACFVFFVGNKHDIYAVLFYPFFILCVAEGLVSLYRDTTTWRSPQRAFVVLLVALLLVSSSVRFARPLVENRAYDYTAITDRIRTAIPRGARVMGLPNWWLGLADYDYRSSLNLTFYHFFNGYTLEEALAADRPDYLIVDGGLRGLLVDEGYFPSGPGFAVYKLPARDLEKFLYERGTRVLDFSNPWHGEFEIYSIDWSRT